MPVFDQFDIAVNFDFSGSYTDDIILQCSGNLITDRKFIGSKTEPVNSGVLTPFFNRYSQTAPLLFSNIKGKNNNFLPFADEKEIFYDSMVPNPIDIHSSDGGEVLLVGPAQTGFPAIGIGSVAVSSSYTINFTNKSSSGLINESKFYPSFPFEIKYKSLLRLKNISNVSSKTYTVVSGSDGTTTKYNLSGSKAVNYFTGNVIYVNKISEAGTIFDFLVDYEGSYTIKTLNSIGLPKASSADMFINTDLEQINTMKLSNVAMKDFYKLYFGTQRKIKINNSTYKMPDFVDFLYGVASPTSITRWGCGPIPAGWKYGLYSALPMKTSAIFRRGKFGQMRDMLEQRLFSKFDNGKTITASPVSLTFISGTASFVTATNDDILNTKDSGMFRKEYTSARPFADDL